MLFSWVQKQTLKLMFCHSQCISSSDTKGHVCYCHHFAPAVCPYLSGLTFHILMVFSETTETYEAKLYMNDVCDVPHWFFVSVSWNLRIFSNTTDAKKILKSFASQRKHKQIRNSYYNLVEIRLPKIFFVLYLQLTCTMPIRTKPSKPDLCEPLSWAPKNMAAMNKSVHHYKVKKFWTDQFLC